MLCFLLDKMSGHKLALQEMILIEERGKNMCIADLFTARCDFITHPNARGENVEV